MKFYILMFLFVFSFPVMAKDIKEANKISALCTHIQTNNTSKKVAPADYVPNVDVAGEPVTPADVDANISLLDPIIIPLEIDIAERYGLDLPLGATMDAKIADIKIHSDGHIEFNDRDISTKIEKLCLEHAKEHGQEKDNPVPSKDQKNLNNKKKDESSDRIEGQYP